MTSVPISVLSPLDDFHRRHGRPLPVFEVVAPEAMPEPDRSLLVHDRDMTRTLERHHGDTIHLRVLSRFHEGDLYGRESILQLDGTGRPVEFGAIRIHLDLFPEQSRRLILEERRPLGGILNDSGIRYTSRPTAFFRIESSSFLDQEFGIHGRRILYGRQNALRDAEGRVLAEIIEILPPGRG